VKVDLDLIKGDLQSKIIKALDTSQTCFVFLSLLNAIAAKNQKRAAS
jgi:hypothetical protein